MCHVSGGESWEELQSGQLTEDICVGCVLTLEENVLLSLISKNLENPEIPPSATGPTAFCLSRLSFRTPTGRDLGMVGLLNGPTGQRQRTQEVSGPLVRSSVVTVKGSWSVLAAKCLPLHCHCLTMAQNANTKRMLQEKKGQKSSMGLLGDCGGSGHCWTLLKYRILLHCLY